MQKVLHYAYNHIRRGAGMNELCTNQLDARVLFICFVLQWTECTKWEQMVDIRESTLTSENFAAKEIEANDNLVEDDLMDNLAYSDSDATSVTMNDEEFVDAVDHMPAYPNDDGKILIFLAIEHISHLNSYSTFSCRLHRWHHG